MSRGMIEFPLAESIHIKNTVVWGFFHISIMEPCGISDSTDDAYM